LKAKKDSKKKFQVNEDESAWGGFLVDADAVAALTFFDRAREAVAHNEPDIVREAWNQRRTIVTSNRRKTAGTFCGLYRNSRAVPTTKSAATLGIGGIPNLQLDQEKGLKDIRRGLHLSQPAPLRWPAVGLLNLYVHLTADGEAEIRHFMRWGFRGTSGGDFAGYFRSYLCKL
jgi:hypothetical protein